MILNKIPGRVYNPEEFKKWKMSVEECGHEWDKSPSSVGNMSGPFGEK